MFKRGEILTYDFKSEKGSKVIDGYHRAVVLHKRETPYRTIMIAAITSSTQLKSKGKIPNNYLELSKDDYPLVLDKDCYVNLDMVATVDGDRLNYLERYGKKYNVVLNKKDLEKLDYKLALTYELQAFVKRETDEAVKSEMNNIIEYIDTDIREKVEKIMEILSDEVAVSLLQELIDKDLIEEIKENYNI